MRFGIYFACISIGILALSLSSSAAAQVCGGEEPTTIFADPDPAVLARGDPAASPLWILADIMPKVADKFTFGIASPFAGLGTPPPPPTADHVQEILWIVDGLAADVVERIYDRLDEDQRAEIELDLQAVYSGIAGLQAHQGLVGQTGAWATGGYNAYEPMFERLRIALQGLDNVHNLDALHSLVTVTDLQLSMVPLDHLYTELVGAQIWLGPLSDLTPEQWDGINQNVATGVGIDLERILRGPNGALTYARGLDYDTFSDDRFGPVELAMTRGSCGDHDVVKRWEFEVHGLGTYGVELRTECDRRLVVNHRLTLSDSCGEALDNVQYFMHHPSVIAEEIEGLYTGLQVQERDPFLVQQYGTIRPQLDAWDDAIDRVPLHLPIDVRLTEVVLGSGWTSECPSSSCTAAGEAGVAFIAASRNPRRLSVAETRDLVDYVILFGYLELENVVAIVSSNPFVSGINGPDLADLADLLVVLREREHGDDLASRVRRDFAALMAAL